MRLLLPTARYPEESDRVRFANDVVARLRAVPAVEGAAAINIMPASNSNSGRSIEIDGVPENTRIVTGPIQTLRDLRDGDRVQAAERADERGLP